jgi:hypothetical protein
MFNRIQSWMNHHSNNVNARSIITHANSSKMTSRKAHGDRECKKDDWANRSGLYHKLSDHQKEYLDKITRILNQEDLDK